VKPAASVELPADPFAILGVAQDADDDAVRARYLALVREHSPERDPEHFAVIRSAYEVLRTRRDRLRRRLFAGDGAALAQLKREALALPEAAAGPGRASRKTVNALLRDGIDCWVDRVLDDARKG
jgi:curved DNA-binding protein CbpA